MKKFQFPFTSPEAQGIRSTAIRHFIGAVEEKGLELHSFILLRHGIKVAEGWWKPYRPEYPHMLFSLSKSFTSSAVGLAVAEGLLTVDDFVVSFFPNQLPDQVAKNLAEMRIRHLLSMSTGHAEDTTARLRQQPEGDWVKAFLSLPVENKPGAPFVYNSGATYMLSAIVQKVTGMPVLEYLKPRLFEPLEIENPTWENCPKGINTGGWGLNICTEDIARFGQMYLQKGIWNGKRILPEAWIEEATRKQVPNGTNPKSDWNQGYGYQFWRCRHNAYRGDGAFGQYCLVMPEQDAVLAITSGLGDMQAVLNLVWKYLLSGMSPDQLKENRPAWGKLKEKLNSLSLCQPEGSSSSPLMPTINGVEYILEPNPMEIKSVKIVDQGGYTLFTVSDANKIHTIQIGRAEGKIGTTTIFSRSGEENLVEARGVWVTPETFQSKLQFLHTPFSWTITCQFSGDLLEMEAATNVSFGPTSFPKVAGKRA